MVKLLDMHGNPIDTGRLKASQTAEIRHLHHEYASHPSRGLTPAKLARVMDAAEQGDIRAQHDLFVDMEEKDGHIFAEMSKRKRALLTGSWSIEPPRNPSAREKKTAAALKELMSDVPNLEDVMLDCLDGIGHGFACLEIEWQRLGRDWIPKAIEHRPQSWFMTDRDTRTQIRLRDLSLDGAPLQPFGWIVHVHKAKSGYLSRAGLHRVLAWPYLFKNYSVRDLAEFLEIYGLPLRLGTYPSGSGDDEKDTLLRAVMQIGHDAAGIIPEGMDIDFKEAAKGSHEPYQAMLDWCERTQSKAILGGTLTTQADGKSSTHALGNVHNEVRHDLAVSDTLQLCGTLTRDLVYPLLVLNIGAVEDMRRLPRFVIDLKAPEDIGIYSDALPKLVHVGMPIPVSWVMDKLAIPAPKNDEPVLLPPQPFMAGPPPALESATAVAAASQTGADAFDLFGDALAGDWEKLTDPLIVPIMALAASAADYEDFQRRLPELIGAMRIDALVEALAQGQFAAAIYGRVRDQQDDSDD
ncbi:DUF935 domain-containing protein [Nitrosomonas halophila]|uniref:Mu-like prophage protein gp29 n=1 Tax=Nitrosomonas halophila TaxID=44576 RepID=A0A1H3FCG8_9PROT|nr:DUF935 domain-containing protein [Nitrosomonas halophila]SDX88691.1 Mu-like prophage protein gp29 [Nitrosomonas halophila]